MTLGRFGRAALAAAIIQLSAPAVLQAAEPRLTVVELYTSQSCPFCPAADAVLAELAQRKDVLALSFHIDYWDFVGWSDPFADTAYTRRQHIYAKRFGLPYVFTPQMVIDGMWQGSAVDHGGVASEMTAAARVSRPPVAVDLSPVSEQKVRVRISETDYAGEAEVLLVRYDREEVTNVTRGNNHGRELRNANVVRDLQPIAVWRGGALDLTIPLKDLGGAGEDYYAVLVQESGQGRIIAATYFAAWTMHQR